MSCLVKCRIRISIFLFYLLTIDLKISEQVQREMFFCLCLLPPPLNFSTVRLWDDEVRKLFALEEPEKILNSWGWYQYWYFSFLKTLITVSVFAQHFVTRAWINVCRHIYWAGHSTFEASMLVLLYLSTDVSTWMINPPFSVANVSLCSKMWHQMVDTRTKRRHKVKLKEKYD